MCFVLKMCVLACKGSCLCIIQIRAFLFVLGNSFLFVYDELGIFFFYTAGQMYSPNLVSGCFAGNIFGGILESYINFACASMMLASVVILLCVLESNIKLCHSLLSVCVCSCGVAVCVCSCGVVVWVYRH